MKKNFKNFQQFIQLKDKFIAYPSELSDSASSLLLELSVKEKTQLYRYHNIYLYHISFCTSRKYIRNMEVHSVHSHTGLAHFNCPHAM